MNNELAGFVDFAEKNYTVYEPEDKEIEGISLEYFLHQVVSQILGAMFPVQAEEVELPTSEIEYMKDIDSKDYYGIIEIVYFAWMSVLCASAMFASEQKNGIGKKFQVAPISGVKLYLGRWIPIVTATAIGIGTAVVATILLYDIHWGNLLVSGIILLLLIMASSSYGLLLYYIFKNLAVTVIVLFSTVWFMGFFGGSFETYMFSSVSQSLKNASPIYHVNRTLVEYSCMGESSYLTSCVSFLIAITVSCTLLTLLVDKMRKGERA